MYLICFIIVIMAGFDDDDISLTLCQEEQEFDVTVISSSSDDDNYDGLLDCARKLAGEISDKTTSSVEGGMQAGVEPGVEPGPSNFPISKTANMVSIISNSMASSLSHSEQSIHVSFIHFNGLYVTFIERFVHYFVSGPMNPCPYFQLACLTRYS